MAHEPRFPAGFLWGASTSGHQTEGNNVNSDWWLFEHAAGSPIPEPSGDACDAYHRYREDVRLLAAVGLTAYRFSVEWARVEPEDGVFSRAELDHYLRVCETCAEHGITPVVDLYHWALPRWAYEHGGWTWPELPARFARFADRVASRLAEHLGYVVTVNEPNLIANLVYRFGVFPWPVHPSSGAPGAAVAERVTGHLQRACLLGRDAVRAQAPAALAGCTLATAEWGTRPGGEDVLGRLQELWYGPFHETAAQGDFVGVQCYTRHLAGPRSAERLARLERAVQPQTDASGRRPEALDPWRDYPDGTRVSDFGWEIRPACLGAAVRRTHELCAKPVLVTENGLPLDDDRARIAFIDEGLESLQRAARDGADVRGYLHWSWLDSYEYIFGFRVHFGLVAVDRTTFARTPKDSARHLGAIARAERTSTHRPGAHA